METFAKLTFILPRGRRLPRARWARPHGNQILFMERAPLRFLPRARWARPHGNFCMGFEPPVNDRLPRARWARPHGNETSFGESSERVPSARTMGAASWKQVLLRWCNDGRTWKYLPRARWARPHGNAGIRRRSESQQRFRAHDGRGLMETGDTGFCLRRFTGFFRAHEGRGLMETLAHAGFRPL